jgi:hypothetical protein
LVERALLVEQVLHVGSTRQILATPAVKSTVV